MHKGPFKMLDKSLVNTNEQGEDHQNQLNFG